jgi:hypothetical protein
LLNGYCTLRPGLNIETIARGPSRQADHQFWIIENRNTIRGPEGPAHDREQRYATRRKPIAFGCHPTGAVAADIQPNGRHLKPRAVGRRLRPKRGGDTRHKYQMQKYCPNMIVHSARDTEIAKRLPSDYTWEILVEDIDDHQSA